YTNFAQSIATNLNTYSATNQGLVLSAGSIGPRTLTRSVDVGQRINAPAGETGADVSAYLAGYILPSAGTLYDPSAYLDPFVGGFETANRGAIITVNAVPGANLLEVWWFRNNQADTNRGFMTVSWPSVIGRYTIQWPSNSPEIVLASNQGSAGSSSDPL